MPELQTLTIIVPAYNEQENLGPVCRSILRLAPQHFADYQVVIIDDASSDGTWQIAQQIAQSDPHFESYRNEKNRGLGYNYYFGLAKARCKWVMLIPGDNEILEESLELIFRLVGIKEVLITYHENLGVRPFFRRLASRIFTHMMNLLFHLHLYYYNGINVTRTDLARQCPRMTDGFAYMATALVCLLRAGYRYEMVGFRVRPRTHGKSKALRPRNVASVIRTVGQLWKSVYTTDLIPALASQREEPAPPALEMVSKT